MKLLDIISEVDLVDKDKTENLKKELIGNTNLSGLTFDNIEMGTQKNTNRIRVFVKNYSCKKHPEWFKDNWTRVDSLKKGDVGCKICGDEFKKKRAIETHTKPEEIHKQGLINSPYTTGLTFNNVEFERIEGDVSKNVYVKNYSCKKHPEWFKDKWTRIDTVKSGDVGCTICGVENHFKPDEKLKQGLINSEYTTGLTFNNVEFKRDTTKDNTNRILIKNYGCKKHRKWFKDKWVYYGGVKIGAQGCDLCAVENSDNLKGWLSDTWTGKFTDNVGYNEWIVKRNKLLQKNWLKTSKETHKNIKYDYSMVDFNDPNTISYVYDSDTKEYKRKPKSGRQFLIGCPVTNHGFFIQDANHHKRGTGCPICRQSRGELYLANLFTSNKIKHLRGRDTKFEKLIGKKYGLISDFYLPKQKVFVEYDGEQHFRPSFGSTESSRMNKYTMTYENDNARNDFAKTNNEGISLIRIPYTMEFADIDKVLMRTIRYIKPNTVVELGDYPKRMKPKKILSKHQVDLTKPIRRPIRENESKLSLNNILEDILLEDGKPINMHPKNKVLIQKAEFAYGTLKKGTYVVEEDENQRTIINWELPDKVEFGFVYDPENGNRPKITLLSDVTGAIVYTLHNTKKTAEIDLVRHQIFTQRTLATYQDICKYIAKLGQKMGRTHINFNGYNPG